MIFFSAQAVYTVEVDIALRGVTYKGSCRFHEFCSFSSTRKQPLCVTSKFLHLLLLLRTHYYLHSRDVLRYVKLTFF